MKTSIKGLWAIIVILAIVAGGVGGFGAGLVHPAGLPAWVRVEDAPGAMGSEVERRSLIIRGNLTATGSGEIDSGLDLNGSDLTIDADADTILDETSDDNIRMTSGAASGSWNILTGNLKIGNGTPGVTQNGEDFYCEGTSEFDGATTFDGAVQFNGSVTGGAVTNDLNGGAFILDPTGNTILRAQVDDTVTLTSASATGTWSILTGNGKVGNGTPDNTQNGEDLYVEGTFEVLGAAAIPLQVTAVTTDTALTAAQKHTTLVLKNESTLSVTLTLPGAVAGLNYCLYNYDGDDVYIDTAAGDQVYVLTNAAGDRVSNTTAGDSVCLVAIDTTYWIALQRVGTWTDAN